MATPSAPQAPTSLAPPNFLSLPLEINNKIYEHYFTPTHPSGTRLPRLHRLEILETPYPGTDILLTTRRIYDEALPIFYDTHTFFFDQIAWPSDPFTPPFYVVPVHREDFPRVASVLRHLSLRVTPALFSSEAMLSCECTLQPDEALPEILDWCPGLRTLTIELSSKRNLDQDSESDPDDPGYWFLTGRPLEPETESFWLFQEAGIRLEIGSMSFPSRAGQVVIPDDQQPLREVLLCDLEKYTGPDIVEYRVWHAAHFAALETKRAKLEGIVGSDTRGCDTRGSDTRRSMVGWTEAGKEIWRETWWKGAIKTTRQVGSR